MSLFLDTFGYVTQVQNICPKMPLDREIVSASGDREIISCNESGNSMGINNSFLPKGTITNAHTHNTKAVSALANRPRAEQIGNICP